MVLRYIAIDLEGTEYPRMYRSDFAFRTRCLCNFIEREIRKSKFQVDGYNLLSVRGCRVPEHECKLVHENALHCPVAFDQRRYDTLSSNDVHEFFIDMLNEGIHKADPRFAVPLHGILDAVSKFRAGGYKNEWIHKTKLLRPTGVRATLACALTPERFTLTLRLERHGATIFDQVILETKPDEIIFAHKFKDVILEDEHDIVVTDKFGRRTFAVDLRTLDN